MAAQSSLTQWPSLARELLSSPAYEGARKTFVEAIMQGAARCKAIQPPRSEAAAQEAFSAYLKAFQTDRGRDLFYPYISSGLGQGPFVELIDGSVKYDMITGIGIHFFGHAHPELLREAADALVSDIMQGNLQPGHEARDLLRALLSRVGSQAKLKKAWLTCSGTMANEIALKIIRQKKFPATKVLAFQDCFLGRSTALQEITDNPGYRDGQPVYGEVQYLPFFDSDLSVQANIDRVLALMKFHLDRYPGRFCAITTELVQGEGGFNSAPREFFEKVFEAAKKAGLAVWIDEIQTFGRTGELFAFQKLGLDAWVDVVTVGKMLQACGLLYTEEYNPKPGLVAGTFSGSAVALRTARRTLELLDEGHFLGAGGRIETLSKRFESKLQALAQGSCQGKLSKIRAVGGMIGFAPGKGTLPEVKALLTTLFDMGLIAFYCGHGPYIVRMLPPLGAMTEAHVDDVCGLLEKGLLKQGAAS